MPALHDQYIDLFQQLGGEQAYIVFEGLVVVGGVVKRGVPQHLANGAVVVDQLVQAVVVDVQIQAQYATHQNAPQGHAGAADGFVGGGGNLLGQQLEDGLAQVSIQISAASQLRHDAAVGVLYGSVDAEFAIQLAGNPVFIGSYLID